MSREQGTVLIVEDNADHAELMRRSLADHAAGARIVHLSDGEAALDYLGRRGAWADPAASPRPRLVLLDLRLPRVDGLEVLRLLKQDPALRAIPVVVFTTSAAAPDLQGACERHANSYLVKPVGFEEFDRLVRDISRYWLGWNATPAAAGA